MEKHNWKKLLLLPLTLTCLSQSSYATLPLGKEPAEVVIEGKNGGKVAGGAWKSTELKGKIHVLFYVDPDESDTNNQTSEALKKQDFPHDKFASVAVINMAATWKPNSLISMKLNQKQKEYPTTVYVEDKTKVLVQQWGLKDDASDVVGFDKEGKVFFSVDGKLAPKDIEELIKGIKANL
jgi:YtfJ family uncharacterized protein